MSDTKSVSIPVKFAPEPAYDVAVTVPDTFTFCKNVAFVLVLILSVDATPVNPEPSPLNDEAVTIPAVSYTHLTLPTTPYV